MPSRAPNPGSPSRLPHSVWLIVAALVIGGASLAYPRTLLDSPLSTYVAMVVLDGGAPYQDAWDVRAPGVFFAYALQILLFGKSAVALRLFDALWQLSTAFVLAVIARRNQERPSAGLIAGISYLILYFSQNYWTWAEPDTFLSLPLALAFLFLLRGLDGPGILYWLLAGAFTGVATLFKMPYGLFGVLLLGVVVQRTWSRPHDLVVRLVGLAAGFVAPLLACLSYIYAKGSLGDFLTSQFVYAPAYVAMIHKAIGFGDFLRSVLRPVLVPPLVLAAIGLGSWIGQFRGPNKPNAKDAVLAGWLALGLLAIFLHGSFLPYHYLSLFAPIALLSAAPLSRIAAEFRAHRRLQHGLLLAVVALSLVIPAEKLRQHAVFSWRVITGRVAGGEARELGEYIKQRTRPDETIFVWGNAPLIYLHAERRAASRFICTAYLSIDSPKADLRAIALRELQKNRPAYIVLYKNTPITPALPDSLTSLRQFPAFQQMLDGEYTVEMETGVYLLFLSKSRR